MSSAKLNWRPVEKIKSSRSHPSTKRGDGVIDEEERMRDSPPPSHSKSQAGKGSTRSVRKLPAHNAQ